MLKDFNKIVQKVAMLKSYYILKKDLDKEYIIVGTRIIIKEHKVFEGNIFQPVTQIIDREVPIFFLISNNEKSADITKDFKDCKFPILNLQLLKTTTSISASRIPHLLDKFISDNF